MRGGLLVGLWGGGRRIDPDVRALASRMTVSPTGDRLTLMSNLVRSLKAAGAWDKIDALWVTAAADVQAAVLNWKSSSFTLTQVNSPTFTADRGFAGNGSTSYLGTGFQTGASGTYLRNDNHMGLWINATGNNGIDMGSTNNSIQVQNASNQMNTRNASVTTNTNATLVTDPKGHTAMARTASGGYATYRAGAAFDNITQGSSALSAEEVYIGARNTTGSPSNFSSRRIAAAHIGAGLTDVQTAALYAALNTYLTAIGGN